MLVGCDPVDLEELAPRCDAVADRLRSIRARLARVDRRVWSGPAARRCWASLDALAPRLGGAAITWELVAHRLRAHATAQRRASLADPVRSVLASSSVGDGRWVARTGSGGSGGAGAARVVMVLVPGVGTTFADRAELDRDARRLWEELAVEAGRIGADPDGVAVVSWLGYDPPDHLVAGLARDPARRGGEALAHELGRLRDGGATRIVVVGHSYGGLVAARGSAAGMRADELVLLGAPGLGVSDVAALHLAPGSDLWAAAADRDAVSLLARAGWVHGQDPVPVARRLPTSRAGHGAYLDDPVLLASLAGLALHDPRPAGTVPPIAG